VDVGSIPLKALQNERLFSLFCRMLSHRYRTDILHEYYRLPDVPSQFTWWNTKITPAEKARRELEFLRNKNPQTQEEQDVVVHEFWTRCRPQGDHLHDHIQLEERYNEIAISASDLKLIKPLFYLFPGNTTLDIADVGAGKNRLGAAILECFEGLGSNTSYFNWIRNLGGPPGRSLKRTSVSVVGTDIGDWRDTDDPQPPGLEYRLQPSATQIPLDDSSKDVIVTKWSFHHMKPHQMRRQIENLFRILRPGGVVIVIEAFLSGFDALPHEPGSDGVAEPNYKQRLLEVSTSIESADIWPEGPWKQDCYEISSEYLDLPCTEQHAILSLEDFFGHYVLNQRAYMPFPFSYLPAEELIESFVGQGFLEQRKNFLLFGLAPVIRRGPPTARFIFQKPCGISAPPADNG
jgi:SAM-dependent methyltransferase